RTPEGADECRSGRVGTDSSDYVSVDISDGGHHAYRVSGSKQAAGQPVGVGVDGKAREDLVPDDDDARLRHAPHNDRGMPRSAYERSKGVETVTWSEFPLGKGLALSMLV